MSVDNEISLLGIFLPIISTIVMGWIGRRMAIKDKEREQAAKFAAQKSKELEQNSFAVSTGLQCLLRLNISQLYEKCRGEGKRSFYDTENMDHMYEAYHGLGGNGMATEILHKFKELPLKR